MKTILFFLSCQLAVSSWQTLCAQEKPDKQNMSVTTQDAFYPKGEQSLYMYVMYNTKYPEESIKKYVEGNVSLSFDVMPDSTVANINIISDPGSGVGEAVKKLVGTLKFSPATMMGVKVKSNVMMDFPIKAH